MKIIISCFITYVKRVYLQETDGNVRNRIDKSHNPLVLVTSRAVTASWRVVWNSEGHIKRQIRSI